MKNDSSEKSLPTPERVREWVVKDINAAHYLLGFVLTHPSVMEMVAEEIYRATMEKERGSGIDHVEKELKEELHAD